MAEIPRRSGEPDLLLDCAVCMEAFEDPRELVCGHYFCRKCLMGIYRRQRRRCVPCPMCRRVTPISANKSIRDLGKPIRIEELKHQIEFIFDGEDSKTLRHCSLCDLDTSATEFCSDCQGTMCKACADGHKDLTLFHRTVPLSGVLFCPGHPQHALTSYCGSCSKWLCPKCLESHSDKHKLENVSQMATQSRNALRQFVHCNVRTPVDKDFISLIKDKTAKVEDRFSKLNESVAELRETHRAMGEKLNALDREVTDQFQAEIQKIQKYESDVTELYASHKRMVSYAKDLLKGSSEAKLIAKEKEFSRALSVRSAAGTLSLKLPTDKGFSQTLDLLRRAMEECALRFKVITIKQEQAAETRAEQELGALRQIDKEIAKLERQIVTSSNGISRYILKAKHDQLQHERANLCRSMNKTDLQDL